ncbi:hypothetical protein BDV09DRAFT_65511 [Aspergillus tetrazonus]
MMETSRVASGRRSGGPAFRRFNLFPIHLSIYLPFYPSMSVFFPALAIGCRTSKDTYEQEEKREARQSLVSFLAFFFPACVSNNASCGSGTSVS